MKPPVRQELAKGERWPTDGQEMVGQRLQWRLVVNIVTRGSESENGDGGRESQTEARGDEAI